MAVRESVSTPSARRAAIGVVAPFDLELDRELWRWMPDDVDLLITRTPAIPAPVTIEFAHELTEGSAVADGVRSVTAGRADVVAYACTSASFVDGRSGERALREMMAEAGAAAALTTSGAIAEALGSLGVDRVAVATPYRVELSVLLDAYLAECGIECVANVSLGLDREIWTVPYERTAELIRHADHPDAQAIVVSCTNLPTYDVLAPLERSLGKPIISANQATMWAALRRLGRRAQGPGQRLIESDPPR